MSMILLEDDSTEYNEYHPRRMTEEEKIIQDKFFNILVSTKPFYARFFKDFLLYTDDSYEGASISEERGIIFIGTQDADNINKLEFLIRHELEHHIFDHQERAMKRMAKRFKMDYNNLSKEQRDFLLNLIYHQDKSPGFEDYGNLSLMNIAGDINNSDFYEEGDIPYVASLGGLMGKVPEWSENIPDIDKITQRPDLADLEYEDMLSVLEKERKQYILDHYPIVKGTFDSNTGKFIVKEGEK